MATYILGLSGGFDPVHEAPFAFGEDFVHDAAAALLKDGKMIVAIEEERLNRIKHCNKIWTESVRFCLREANISLHDLDAIAIYASEPFLAQSLKYLRLHKPLVPFSMNPTELYQDLFDREFGFRPASDKFKFIHHHHAHAMSAYALSGFSESLVVTLDGAGDDVSTMVFHAKGKDLNLLASKPISESLGFFYLEVIRFLGYAIFDEYKVMGLAPYGDRKRFAPLIKTFYSLLPDGDYAIHSEKIADLFQVLTPRKRGEAFQQVHKDIAAGLQEALEEIVFHILNHYRAKTGLENLCLAGGVAQNSSMNGKILASGLFKRVYVPVAAADSGCAIGAAMAACAELSGHLPAQSNLSIYLGSAIGSDDEIEILLDKWKHWIDFEKLENTAKTAAQLMAEGAVLGWVQGRSEFGPRALGNRSILADPRPAAHKELINAMIKKREGYRPFAPSVLEERAGDFFEFPPGVTQVPLMTFVLPVKEVWRERLGAIAHVDGTARVQTVPRESNPLYWSLISEFGALTGVPMLLNTSFNNNSEPIVDNVQDAIVCFLTSGLHGLVAGNFLVRKKEFDPERILTLNIALPAAARLVSENVAKRNGDRISQYSVAWNYDMNRRELLSAAAYEILEKSNGKRSSGSILHELGHNAISKTKLAEELTELWSKRFIILTP